MRAKKSNPFFLLFKKNLKIEIRTWYFTLCEIVIIFACLLLDMFDPSEYRGCYLSVNDDSVNKMNFSLLSEQLYPSQNPQKTKSSIMRTLYYAPKNSSIDEIVGGIETSLGLSKSVGYETVKSMKKAILLKKPMAAIEFHDASNKSLDFTLHTPTEGELYRNHINMRSLEYVKSTMTEPNNPININFKNTLLIQHRIYLEWLKLNELSKDKIPSVQVLVSREGHSDTLCEYFEFSHLSWFCYAIMYLLPYLNQIWRYSKELEDNVYCHQWMYGIENSAHWFAHFVVSFIHLQILNIIVITPYAILWKIYMSLLGRPSAHAFMLIFIAISFLMIHNIILILCAMVTANMFRNAKNAMLFGITMWIASYGLHVMFINAIPYFNWAIIVSFILFFNNILPYGLHLLSELHLIRLGELLIIPCFAIVYIIILTIILDLLDYWYLYNQRESRQFSYLGMPQCCKKRKKPQIPSILYTEPQPHITRRDLLQVDVEIDEKVSWHNYEMAPPIAVQVLSLKNVYTYYDKGTVNPQLRDITMDIYKGEISVIVGSEGMVKKAFIETLAGWRQYHGSIYFNGTMELQNNLDEYKRYADVCMETNPLYGFLNVKETLTYFIHFKRQEKNIEKESLELSKWLEKLNTFGVKGEKLINDLSYSQKRLVALCCVLCTDTPIILLVEPTLNMKSAEQSFYWETLQHAKPHRCIIITTYSLDEAERIGDRIAILNEGYILAWGSLLYLKNSFASNYTLIVVREPNAPLAPITELIQSNIGYVEVSVRNNIISYKLPGNRRNEYQKILIDLEARTDTLGIQNFRVEGGDLREVITNLTMKYELAEPTPDLSFTLKLNEPILQKDHYDVYAMLYKRAISQKYNVAPIIAFLVAAIFIIHIHIMTKHFRIIGYDSRIETFSLNSFRQGRSLGILRSEVSCPYLEVKEPTGNNTKKNEKQNIETKYEYYTCSSNPNNITRIVISKKKTETLQQHKKNLGVIELKADETIILHVPYEKQQTLPLSLNLVEDFILSRVYPNKSKLHTYVNLEIYNGQTNWQFIEIRALCVPLTLGIIMPIISSALIINLVDELKSGFVTTQKLAGLNMGVFWLMTFIWDQIVYVAIMICCFVLMLITTFESTSIFLSLLILLLIYVYSIPAILLNYVVAQFVSTDKCKAFLIVLNVHLIIGLCAYTFYIDVVDSSDIFLCMFMISPLFALMKGAHNVYPIALGRQDVSEQEEIESSLMVWRPSGILVPITCMSITAFLLVILLAVITRCRHFNYFTARRIKRMISGYFLYEDDAVIAEKIEISTLKSTNIKHFNVVVDQLEGVLPQTSRVLNSVSFKVDKQTCFCIYGTHNSGKSHLLRQLIGEEYIYYGEVYICQINIRRHVHNAYKYIGYCPQEGGFLEVFTPYQILTLLYFIHGVPKNTAGEYIRRLSISLNLQPHLYKRILTLPYGVKRRLNVAICLMGHKDVLILDEPTKGLSSYDSKLVANVIRYARYSGKSVIITTSDSYECEALADTIMVVNNGSMLALGTPQQLRHTYTTGFYLEIKLLLDGETDLEMTDNLETDIENVTRFVHFLQERSELVKQQNNVLLYYLPVPTITYSHLFAAVEKNRTRLNIAEYTVHLGTLVDAMESILLARQKETKFTK